MDKEKLDRLGQESRARASRIGSVEVAEAMIDADRAKALVEVGGDLDEVTNNVGWTPLMMAVRRRDLKSVDMLVQAGARSDLKDGWGETALMMAVKAGYSGAVKAMVEKGTDVDVSNDHGWTALMMAASTGNRACLDSLAEAGANLDLKSEFGYTALMMASTKCHSTCIEMLVKAGADESITRPDRDGVIQTAEDMVPRHDERATACLDAFVAGRSAHRAAELDRKLDQACDSWSPPTASTNSIKTRQASSDTLTQAEQQAPVSRSRQRF